MVKGRKNWFFSFSPILYLLAIFGISFFYFGGNATSQDYNGIITLNIVESSSNFVSKSSLKQLEVLTNGSVFLINRGHRPLLITQDGEKRLLNLLSFDTLNDGYRLNFSHNVAVQFSYLGDALRVEALFPPEIQVASFTIPWQTMKGFSLDGSNEQVEELKSADQKFYFQYRGSSVLVEGGQSRITFFDPLNAQFTLSSNNFGELKTLDDFMRASFSYNEESYNNEQLAYQYQILLDRLQKDTGLFTNKAGAPTYNEQAIALLLAFAHQKGTLENDIARFKPDLFEDNALSTPWLSPYYGYGAVPDTKQILTKIETLREAIRNDDQSIFYQDDLFRFIDEHNLYPFRAQLVNLATHIEADESSLLLAKKLYFVIQAIVTSPLNAIRADELGLANTLVRTLLLNHIVWLNDDLYLYNGKEISILGALLTSYAFNLIVDNNLLPRYNLEELKTMAFYLRRGSLTMVGNKGYFPVSLFWDGTNTTVNTEFVTLENVGEVVWPNLVFPKIYSQRRYLQPGMNVYTLATEMRSSFYDVARQVIQFDFTLPSPSFQHVVVSGIDRVGRVTAFGANLDNRTTVQEGRESWYYDRTKKLLHLYLKQREEPFVRYRIYLEAKE